MRHPWSRGRHLVRCHRCNNRVFLPFTSLPFPSFFPCARSLAGSCNPIPRHPPHSPLFHPMSWPYHMVIPMGHDFLFLFLIKLDLILLSYVVCSQIWLNYFMDDRHFSCITKLRKKQPWFQAVFFFLFFFFFFGWRIFALSRQEKTPVRIVQRLFLRKKTAKIAIF